MSRERTLIPCPRCGNDFWPWAKNDHARKTCADCITAARNRGAARRAEREKRRVEHHHVVLSDEQKREKDRLKAQAYYQQNTAKKIAANHRYRLRARARPEYRLMEQACVRRWNRKHPEQFKAHVRSQHMRRRARKHAAFIEAVHPTQVYQRANGVCGICHLPVALTEDWHVDHIIPLAKGGAHSYRNTQLAHSRCNIEKGDKLPDVSLGGGVAWVLPGY